MVVVKRFRCLSVRVATLCRSAKKWSKATHVCTRSLRGWFAGLVNMVQRQQWLLYVVKRCGFGSVR